MVNEFARQGFHLLFTLLLALLAWLLAQHWFLLLCASLLFVGSLLVYFRPVGTAWLLSVFDREEPFLPGRGAFMAVAGAFFVSLLFPAQAAASLVVLAVADSVATLAGKQWGLSRVPWSASKSWVGVGAFFVSACFVLVFVSSWWWLVALFATVVEAADYSSYPFLDDNVLIPLTVAAALLLF